MKAALALLALLAALPALADPSDKVVEAVMQRDFHPRGQATLDRIPQDSLQRLCTQTGNQPSPAAARKMEAEQAKSIRYPDGSLIGDWKRGEKIAQNGRGMTWQDKPGVPAGGSCYNCHEISPAETNFGTIGPSLRGFGRLRGQGAEVQRYVYGKIFNAKATRACSPMPRLGSSGTLTPEQIEDLVALLLDPASPVNR